jgi:hypothetical protein
VQHTLRSDVGEQPAQEGERLNPRRVELVFRYLDDEEGMARAALVVDPEAPTTVDAPAMSAVGARRDEAIRRRADFRDERLDGFLLGGNGAVGFEVTSDRPSRTTISAFVASRRSELVWYLLAVCGAVMLGILAAHLI